MKNITNMDKIKITIKKIIKKYNSIIFILFVFFILLIFYVLFVLWKNRTEHFTDKNDLKIAVITSIYGNYDNLKDQTVENSNSVDWFCFTDNTKTSNFWKIINKRYHLEDEFNDYYDTLKKEDTRHYNVMCAKYYKIKTHNIDILKKYDYFIWIDGSSILHNDFLTNVKEILNSNRNIECINFKHSVRDNIKDECAISLTIDKYKKFDLNQQLEDYKNEGFNDDIGLFENGIFIRKNDALMNNAFDDWFKQNIKYGFQCQISMPYIYWKYGIKPYVINENVYSNDKFSKVELHN